MVWIERGVPAQEPLLVGVEDRDQGHLGQVEALAQEVDAHQHVEVAQAQRPHDADALEGVDLRVQVARPDAGLHEVLGEVLGHPLGERGHQRPLAALGPRSRISPDEVVDLVVGGPHLHLGVHQAGRPDDLLHHVTRRSAARTRPASPRRRRSGSRARGTRAAAAGRLSSAEGSRKPASISASLRERSPSYMPRSWPIVLCDSSMKQTKSSGKKSSSVWGGSPGAPPVEDARVVLDARAEAQLAHHLHVVLGALAQPVGLHQLAGRLEAAPPAPRARRGSPAAPGRWSSGGVT